MRTIYLNGQYMPETQATISPFDRGFLFADAIYEVVAVLDGKLIDFNKHMERFIRSADALQLGDVGPVSDWLTMCRELVRQNNLTQGIIYWQITRGNPGERSFLWPSPNTPHTQFAFAQPMNLVDDPKAKSGLSIITLPDLRWGRVDIKTTQLLYGSMMKQEAKSRGVDDAWLERDGMITEGTSQNAHIISADNVLVTHPLSTGILHGITRATMLELLTQQGLALEERSFSVAEAQAAKEAFVTSASAFVMPVTQINGIAIGDGTAGPLATALRAAYIDLARANAI